jgi:hypothetical protein
MPSSNTGNGQDEQPAPRAGNGGVNATDTDESASGPIEQKPITGVNDEAPSAGSEAETPTAVSPNTPAGDDNTEQSNAMPTTPDNRDPVQRYEGQLRQVEAACTAKLTNGTSEAEAEFQKLESKDRLTVANLSNKWTRWMEEAERGCDRDFEEVTDAARQEAVDLYVIDEWTLDYRNSIGQKRDEFNAKLQQLLAG